MKITKLQKKEFPQLLNALYLQGWYLENVHLESLYKEFKENFFCIHIDKKPIAFILAIKYTQRFGLISNFVVLKKFRKHGFGAKLFKYALQHLEGCQILLECEKDKEAFYKNYGFSTYYDSVYYFYEKKENHDFTSNKTIKSVINTKLLNKYNTKLLSQNFANYLENIIKHKDTKLRVIYQGSTISDYGLSTKYLDGYKLAIASQNYEEVKELFFSLINKYPLKTKIYIEITDLEQPLVKLCQFLKMKEFSRKSKMYNKIL